jgi:Ca-activated chloride channel family protein
MTTSVRQGTADLDALLHGSPWYRIPLVCFAIVVALAAAALLAATAAGCAAALPRLSPGEARMGSLLLRDGERTVEAPRLATDIDITVSGPTARARITQLFANPTSEWVEAVYVNPLPDGGAVDTLKMVIGERIVVGEIKERRQAKAIYEDAKRAGQKATLFEQERPNLFTNSVANIGPGETVLVQIEYQEPVRRSGNVSSLRVPLVVAPRYVPAPVVQAAEVSGRGWGEVSDTVPDRDRITPPVLDPAVEPPTNPVAITVRLNAGFPLGEVKSRYHAITMETPADDARIVKLDAHVVPADRDFELTWTPAATSAPSIGLFREHVGTDDYLLALVTPPLIADARAKPLPREVVFVIDNSGSMGGTSIMQAKASLIYALDRLKAGDRFNVIRFDDTMDVLFADPVAADRDNIARAKSFVSALQARGGTEMVPPMKAALADRNRSDEFLRQVVFLTDGEIGNEKELFETIAAMRGRSRVFMVGIGSAPNSFLMTRAAEIGRGTFTHIGSVDEVQERMRELADKLESPAVTSLAATYSGGAFDATPAALPDLYRGEPVVIAAKVGSLDGTLEISGMIGDRPWSVSMPVAKAAEGAGLSKLWARRKITDAEMARRRNAITADEADQRVLALALEHHLVSRLTSLIAVDATPSRPKGVHLARADLPLNLPAGWEFDKVFGERKPQAVPVERRAGARGQPEIRQASATQAAKPMAYASTVAAAPAAVRLPRTATSAELELMAGLLALALSLLLLFRCPLHPAAR